jgi:hypothetical protein
MFLKFWRVPEMTTSTTDSRFCSVCARQAGLNPGGTGGAAFATIIAAELPLPWPVGMFSDPQRMPPEFLAVMAHIRDEYQRTHAVRVRQLGIAPDAEYSTPGMRRVIGWQRPEGPFSAFVRAEYLVPDDQLGPLFYALALAPERLEAFAAYRQDVGDVRDLLVCTHGSVDAACSKFGTRPTRSCARSPPTRAGGYAPDALPTSAAMSSRRP